MGCHQAIQEGCQRELGNCFYSFCFCFWQYWVACTSSSDGVCAYSLNWRFIGLSFSFVRRFFFAVDEYHETLHNSSFVIIALNILKDFTWLGAFVSTYRLLLSAKRVTMRILFSPQAAHKAIQFHDEVGMLHRLDNKVKCIDFVHLHSVLRYVGHKNERFWRSILTQPKCCVNAFDARQHYIHNDQLEYAWCLPIYLKNLCGRKVYHVKRKLLLFFLVTKKRRSFRINVLNQSNAIVDMDHLITFWLYNDIENGGYQAWQRFR